MWLMLLAMKYPLRLNPVWSSCNDVFKFIVLFGIYWSFLNMMWKQAPATVYGSLISLLPMAKL